MSIKDRCGEQSLSKIQKDIKDYIMQMKLNPNFDEFAEYLITEEDYIYMDKAV